MDILKTLLEASGGPVNPSAALGPNDVRGNYPDAAMVRSPSDAVSGDNNEVTGEKIMQDRARAADPNVITDDSGKQVDYDTGDPISRALKGIITKPAEQGTMRNFLQRVIDPARERDSTDKIMQGGGTPTVDQATNPVPTKLQPQVALAPAKNYSNTVMQQPTIDQLRASLFQQTGQGAVPNSGSAAAVAEGVDPNSLAGRMTGPNSRLDTKAGMSEAEAISNRFRPIMNSPIQRPGKKPDTPFSGIRDWLNRGNANG